MKSVPAPLISVLMPVYNGENFLSEAIDSILNQTFTNFEFVIINDGSIDGTEAILRRYEGADSRLRVYHQENRGIANSLNRGIELCRGEYIARMDADDISLPSRFEKQVSFMEKHHRVGVCGTWIKVIGKSSEYILQYPQNHSMIRCQLIFGTAIAHPTAFMRRAFFIQHALRYLKPHAEDYDLWVRCAKHFELANINEVLLLYRIHYSGMGQRHCNEQRDLSQCIRLKQLRQLWIKINDDEANIHQSISLQHFHINRQFILQVDAWLKKLSDANHLHSTYPELEFSKVLGHRWWIVCQQATELGPWIWKMFWQSPLSQTIDLSWKQKIKFAIKCGISYKA